MIVWNRGNIQLGGGRCAVFSLTVADLQQFRALVNEISETACYPVGRWFESGPEAKFFKDLASPFLIGNSVPGTLLAREARRASWQPVGSRVPPPFTAHKSGPRPR
jgi:hypothetical protein